MNPEMFSNGLRVYENHTTVYIFKIISGIEVFSFSFLKED